MPQVAAPGSTGLTPEQTARAEEVAGRIARGAQGIIPDAHHKTRSHSEGRKHYTVTTIVEPATGLEFTVLTWVTRVRSPLNGDRLP